MIDPNLPFNFDRSPDELFEWFLFSVLVAGKNADTQAKKLAMLRDEHDGHGRYFNYASFSMSKRTVVDIDRRLRNVKAGQYARLTKLLWTLNLHMLAGESPLYWPRDRLVTIPGVGLKTASFYRMYAFPDSQCAALDVHILKFLGDVGATNVPRQTPSRNEYLRLEQRFISETRKLKVQPWVLDIYLWMNYREGRRWSEILTGLQDFATKLDQDQRFAGHVFR